MFVEMAIGDAYGIAYEFIAHTDDRPNDLLSYKHNPRYLTIKPGTYTDDTQRSLGNVEVMLNGDITSMLAYAESYVRVFKNDPRDAYSRRYQALLEGSKDGTDFLSKVQRAATSNGSIMGAAVFGYLPDVATIKLACDAQTLTTHSFHNIPYAQAVALVAHYFIYDVGTKQDLKMFLDQTVDWGSLKESDPKRDYRLGPESKTTMEAWTTYRAVMRGIERFDSLSDLLHYCIDLGGDTDSVAAISMAIASCSKEFKKDLPQPLYDNLENGEFGRYYLAGMEAKLVRFLREKWLATNRAC